MTLPLAFYIDTEDQTPDLRACAPSTVDASIFPAVFYILTFSLFGFWRQNVLEEILFLSSDWQSDSQWAHKTFSPDLQAHMAEKHVICLLIGANLEMPHFAKCPVSEQREEKGELYNCGWHRREGWSGALLAVACFVYFRAQQKATWDSCRASFPTPSKPAQKGKTKPPSVTKNPNVKCKYHPATQVRGERVLQRLCGYCRGECKAVCTGVNEEGIKDPV